jgi:hypothetical protein
VKRSGRSARVASSSRPWRTLVLASFVHFVAVSAVRIRARRAAHTAGRIERRRRRSPVPPTSTTSAPACASCSRGVPVRSDRRHALGGLTRLVAPNSNEVGSIASVAHNKDHEYGCPFRQRRCERSASKLQSKGVRRCSTRGRSAYRTGLQAGGHRFDPGTLDL